MSRLPKNLVQLLAVVVLPLLLVILAALIVQIYGNSNLAYIVSYGGTVGVLIGAMCYVVFFDSRSRWPDANAWQRFVKVISFTR